MRRKTISILAVAFTTTTAACGGATETTRDQSSQRQSAAEGADKQNEEKPAPISSASPPAPDPPAPAAAPACDRDALNKELSGTLLEDAVTQHEHFRCLCDDKGYPLVGNINSKGATASSFCAAITEKGLL